MSVKRAIFWVTGLAKPHISRYGIPDLYRDTKGQVPASTEVALYAWDDYERIMDDYYKWEPEETLWIGHSYGVSTSLFALMAIILNERDRRGKDDLLATDGVWREKVDEIDLDSLEDDHELSVPINVRYLYTFRQKRGRIRGHDYEIHPPTEWVTDVIVERPRHAKMDRLPEFQCLARNLVLGS